MYPNAYIMLKDTDEILYDGHVPEVWEQALHHVPCILLQEAVSHLVVHRPE